MQKVRVIELPDGRAVYTGSPEDPEVFGRFAGWVSGYMEKETDDILRAGLLPGMRQTVGKRRM